MPKRSFPFYNNSAQLMKTHVTPMHVEKDVYMEKVYARTKDLLLKGAEEVQKNGYVLNAEPAKEFKCHQCKQLRREAMVTCSFCEKGVCAACHGTCFACGAEFCRNCSIVNYGDMGDVLCCLGCWKS
ncbi:apoptosis regulatory protein Siva [Nematostella vectensis]|uniref:apoptosis regulatory protein Siva n=1 Tax=Nematostella vectensis TaxID=45351 RepID=UPI002077453B|nr:apoptosis regulatory protein Siva [Nematostella vectensis]